MKKFVVLVVVAMFLGCVREPSVVVTPIVVEIPPASSSSSAPTVLPGAKSEENGRISFREIEFRAPPGWVIDTSRDKYDVLLFDNAKLDGHIGLQIRRVSWENSVDTANAFIESFRKQVEANGKVIDEMSIDQSLGRAVVRYSDPAMPRHARTTLVLLEGNHHLRVTVNGEWPPESDGECNAVMGILELSVTIAQEK